MLPYFLLLYISGVFPLLVYQPVGTASGDDNGELVEKRNKMTIFLFFFCFFVLLALRDITVGKDLYTYKSIFESCFVTSFENLSNMQWELGYAVYNKIISMLSADYRLFLIVTSVITLVPIYKLYSQEKRYGFLSIVLFINMPCFLLIFSGLRQAIAVSIGILVYMAVANKKYVFSVLLILFGVCFHMSAFVLILIYPAFFLKVKTKHLLYIIPIMLGVYLLRVPIFLFLLNFMPSRYIEFYGEVQHTGAFGMMVLCLIFFVFSFVISDEASMSERDYFMRNVLLIATVFQFFVPIHGLIQRMSYYFLIFVPISILSVIQVPKRYLKNVSNFAIVVMGCFFTLYFFYNAAFSTDNLLDVFPYKFYWSGQGW